MSGLSHMSFMDALRVAAQTKEAPQEWGGSDSLARTPSWPAGLSEMRPGSASGAGASPLGGPGAGAPESPAKEGCTPELSRPGSAAGSRKRQWGAEGEGEGTGARVLQRGVSENFRSTQGVHRSPIRNSHLSHSLLKGSQASRSYRERSPVLGSASEMPQSYLRERSPMGLSSGEMPLSYSRERSPVLTSASGTPQSYHGRSPMGALAKEASQSYKEKSPVVLSAREAFPRHNSTPTSTATPSASSSSFISNASSFPSPVPSSVPSSPSIPSTPAPPLRACQRSLSLPRSSLDSAFNPQQLPVAGTGPMGPGTGAGSGYGTGMGQAETCLLRVPSTQSLAAANYHPSSSTPPRFQPGAAPLAPSLSLQCTPPRPPPPSQPLALVHPGLTLQGPGPQQMAPPLKRRKPFDLSWISAVAGSLRTPWAGRAGRTGGAPDEPGAGGPVGTPLGGPPAAQQPQAWQNKPKPLLGPQTPPMLCSATPNSTSTNTPTGTPVGTPNKTPDSTYHGVPSGGYSAIGTPPPARPMTAPGVDLRHRGKQHAQDQRSPRNGSHLNPGGFSGNSISASGSREAPSLPSLPEVFQWGPDSLGASATLTLSGYNVGTPDNEGGPMDDDDDDEEEAVFRRTCTEPSMRHTACGCTHSPHGVPHSLPNGVPDSVPPSMIDEEDLSGPLSGEIIPDNLGCAALPAWNCEPHPGGSSGLDAPLLEDIFSEGGAYAAQSEDDLREADRMAMAMGMGEGDGDLSEPWSGAGAARLEKSSSRTSSAITPPQLGSGPAGPCENPWESHGYASAQGRTLKAVGSSEEVGSCAWAAPGTPADGHLAEKGAAGDKTASALAGAACAGTAGLAADPAPTAGASAGVDGTSNSNSNSTAGQGEDEGPTIELPARAARLAEVDDAQIEALATACMDSLALLVPPRHAAASGGSKSALAPSPGNKQNTHASPSPSASRRGGAGPFAPLIIPSPSTFSPSAAFAFAFAPGAPFGAPFVAQAGTPTPLGAAPGAPTPAGGASGAPSAAPSGGATQATPGAPRRPAPLVVDGEGMGTLSLPEGGLDLCGNSPGGGDGGMLHWDGNLPTPNMGGTGGPASPWGEAWSEGLKAELPSPSLNTRLW